MTAADSIGLAALGSSTPIAHLLSNGRYQAMITAAGSGYSACDGWALTRWLPDRTRDADGFCIYISEPATSNWWSAGFEPSRAKPDSYRVEFTPGMAAIVREDDGIESRLEIIVAPDLDCELRRLTLTNRSDRPRELVVTSYAEVVLNGAAADSAHPAFSKLFVSTERLTGSPVLLARRRPRSPEDPPLWLLNALRVEGSESAGTVETDRMRFLGRGHDARSPDALRPGGTLSGTTGNVLDPVMSIGHSVRIAPGGQAGLMATLAFGSSRDAIVPLATAGGDWERLCAAAVQRDSALRSRFELSGKLERALPCLTGALLYGHPALRAGSTDEAPSRLEEIRRVAGWWKVQGLRIDPEDPADADRLGGLAAVLNETSLPPGVVGTRELPASNPAAASTPPPSEPLREWNGSGGFSADGTEYVIRIPADGRKPPVPWTNVMANEECGTLVSESGASTSWSGNSREHRLTPWFNDPVSDPHGEALFIRDEATGRCWCPTPGPRPAPAAYEVRHGFGFTRFLLEYDGLSHELTQFVPRHGAIKANRLRLTNRGTAPRELAVYGYTQLVMGTGPEATWSSLVTSWDHASGAVLARNDLAGEFNDRVCCVALIGPKGSSADATANRGAFLGSHGAMELPAAIRTGGALDGATGAGLDPCAALRTLITIPPGQTVECTLLLGEAGSVQAARALLDRWRDPAAVEIELAGVQRFWRQTVGGLQVLTPVPALDLMLNGWLAYQNLCCRMWGRTAFYQSGGAFGFRDQLQDSAALLLLNPAITRQQILLHAAHQFVEGDVLHWWHPPASKGIRTRFADDLLWLPLLTAHYVEQTGDWAVLNESARFLHAPALDPGEDERLLTPTDDGTSASIYEHCCRAVDRSLKTGAHGLPLFGTGDWNDGMNRVGREGRGESVWMGFFLAQVLERFITIAASRKDHARAERYRLHRAGLITALNQGGWDGGWYRRGYFDDGIPLGSAASEECRIDAIAQAWSVLSGSATPDRATTALDALESHLVSDTDGIIRLLEPPFDRTAHDPGYIKGYLPGVRENGGQYTHGALWAVQALAEAGRSDRAAELLTMLSPVTRARNPESVAIYQTEPYVIAADVYGVAPHVGRGGWTWYTGSAGWMFRVAVESILGLSLDAGEALVIRPALPKSWPGCTIEYRLPDGRTRYRLRISRSTNPSTVTTMAMLDGRPAEIRDGNARIPLLTDGAEHDVEIAFHPAAHLQYRPRP
ncbi:MAG: glycosyl transferase [Gemmatimonadota bacterium]